MGRANGQGVLVGFEAFNRPANRKFHLGARGKAYRNLHLWGIASFCKQRPGFAVIQDIAKFFASQMRIQRRQAQTRALNRYARLDKLRAI